MFKLDKLCIKNLMELLRKSKVKQQIVCFEGMHFVCGPCTGTCQGSCSGDCAGSCSGQKN